MTERQGRLVSKIQGYEGKDQKTSQSLSSVCSWVPRRESEASKRWEESWWWGDRSSSSPGQWQNSNYRQRWHVMESFTLQLYRKWSEQNTCINTLCDRRTRERKEGWKASSATALSSCLCYQERGQPKAGEAKRCVLLQQTSRTLLSWMCGGWAVPVFWTVLGAAPDTPGASRNHRSVLDAASNDPETCAFICYAYIYSPFCRLKTTERALQETFEPQTPLQKQGTSASVESQPAASPQSIPPMSWSSSEWLPAALPKQGFGGPRNTWVMHGLTLITDWPPRARAGGWPAEQGLGESALWMPLAHGTARRVRAM